ncbi:uncharacterized protein CLUP02_17087 [Colletotrichum lupini]|uniref:Uncharacterized protein n=1 Tax=Colletotrichum lupini TaxID=145971 RepID=A0A9Q8WQA3_9PEZI|nr:uncharacterized protein CLUP02_17087 [Colletotrichum lupini]UQC91551.1 hypothetical protein CLUP02_17087 [Colletotrichum lupini]
MVNSQYRRTHPGFRSVGVFASLAGLLYIHTVMSGRPCAGSWMGDKCPFALDCARMEAVKFLNFRSDHAAARCHVGPRCSSVGAPFGRQSLEYPSSSPAISSGANNGEEKTQTGNGPAGRSVIIRRTVARHIFDDSILSSVNQDATTSICGCTGPYRTQAASVHAREFPLGRQGFQCSVSRNLAPTCPSNIDYIRFGSTKHAAPPPTKRPAQGAAAEAAPLKQRLWI